MWCHEFCNRAKRNGAEAPHLHKPVGRQKAGPTKAREDAALKGRLYESKPENYSAAPRGRKYWVPLTGSWRRRRSCWRSSLRSTKSMSEVFITSKSEAS